MPVYKVSCSTFQMPQALWSCFFGQSGVYHRSQGERRRWSIERQRPTVCGTLRRQEAYFHGARSRWSSFVIVTIAVEHRSALREHVWDSIHNYLPRATQLCRLTWPATNLYSTIRAMEKTWVSCPDNWPLIRVAWKFRSLIVIL